MSTNVHSDQYLQHKVLLSFSLVIPGVKGNFQRLFFHTAQYQLTTSWQRNMKKANGHKHSWIFLLVMALLNFTTALWLILSISMAQVTSPHLSNYSSAAGNLLHQIAGNTHVLIYEYYSAHWMLKVFLEQQTKNEEENSPLGLAVLVCWHFSRNELTIISLAKKITDDYFLVPVFSQREVLRAVTYDSLSWKSSCHMQKEKDHHHPETWTMNNLSLSLFQHHPASCDRLHWSQHCTLLILFQFSSVDLTEDKWASEELLRPAQHCMNERKLILHMTAKNPNLLLNPICWWSYAMILLLPAELINCPGSNFFCGKSPTLTT